MAKKQANHPNHPESIPNPPEPTPDVIQYSTLHDFTIYVVEVEPRVVFWLATSPYRGLRSGGPFPDTDSAWIVAESAIEEAAAAPMTTRICIQAKYPGRCPFCRAQWAPGDEIVWSRKDGPACMQCEFIPRKQPAA